MNLTGIIAIAGKPGLYKVISRSKSGLVVENLADKKKMPALATHKISALEDISIYTEGEDMPLSEVFDKVYAFTKGGATIDSKADGAELFSYFAKIIPEFDKGRVYPSDLKKLFSWYAILLAAGIFEVKAEEAQKSDIQDAEIIEETKED